MQVIPDELAGFFLMDHGLGLQLNADSSPLRLFVDDIVRGRVPIFCYGGLFDHESKRGEIRSDFDSDNASSLGNRPRGAQDAYHCV